MESIAERHAGPIDGKSFYHLTAQQVATVRQAARSIEGSFNSFTLYHLSNDLELEAIAVDAITNDASPVFSNLRSELQDEQTITGGMVCDALNLITRIAIDGEQPIARQDAGKRIQERRRRQGRCICCNRPLSDPDSLQRGFGPECARLIAVLAA